MRHGRPDYDSIQDTDGGANIHPDEPVFLLRAKDVIAAEVVRYWAKRAAENGVDNYTYKMAINQAERMEKWPVKKNPPDVKRPTGSDSNRVDGEDT